MAEYKRGINIASINKIQRSAQLLNNSVHDNNISFNLYVRLPCNNQIFSSLFLAISAKNQLKEKCQRLFTVSLVVIKKIMHRIVYLHDYVSWSLINLQTLRQLSMRQIKCWREVRIILLHKMVLAGLVFT